jgi:hypothetical protein
MSLTYLTLPEVSDRQALGEMTYPAYRQRLLAPVAGQEPIGVAAFTEDGPCGLALAQPGGFDPAEVFSVFVERSMRREGVGGELLARVTALLQSRNEPVVLARYPRGRETTPAVERMLAKQGWSQPAPHLYLFHVRVQSVADFLRASWLRPRPMPPPSPCSTGRRRTRRTSRPLRSI